MTNMSDPPQHRLHRIRDVSDGLGTPYKERELEDDEQSIIDVFEFDDTADDRWLCSAGSRRSSVVEPKIDDLDAWLHAEAPETEVSNFENGSRRPIDTRTFVRIKRKSGRLSFEPREGSVSPETKTFSSPNVWKNQSIPESTSSQDSNTEKEQINITERRDSVPMMLRPKSNQVLSAILSESPSSISSQTSMEAFKNLAHSKEGLNSLLSDISDPDISSILMNISQPSFLYSSIINDERGESGEQLIGGNSLVDSQILTDSMMEASMFKEVQDTSLLTDFLKQNNDCTVLENDLSSLENDRTFTCESLGANDTYVSSENGKNHTFVSSKNENKMNTTQVLSPATNSLNSTRTISSSLNSTKTLSSQENSLNATRTISSSLNSTKTLSSQENSLNATQILSKVPSSLNSTRILQESKGNSLNSTQIITKTPPSLNCTKTLHSDYEKSKLNENYDIFSTTQTLDNDNKTDLTFEINTNLPNQKRLDATFQASNVPADLACEQNELIENGSNTLDVTFDKASSLRSELLQQIKRSSGNKFDSTFTNTKAENIEIPATIEPSHQVKTHDATYVQESLHAKKSLNETFNKTQANSRVSNIGGPRQISSFAKRNSPESQGRLLEQNRFNTFKKESKIACNLPKAPPPQIENHLHKTMTIEPEVPALSAKTDNSLYQQRFNTFSKKSNIFSKNSVDYTEPADKLVKPKQILPPRQLTRLPGLFQKSNPNLGSTSKLLGKIASESNIGFMKGSQPNISSNAYSNNALSRFKSEQRLMQMKHNPEFSSGDGTSHSMESIGSTGSAQSAPDLDDRASMCSDNSRASYTIKPRNLQMYKQHSAEERTERKFTGSTPRVKGQQVLENTWVEGKNLPSPILKNGYDRYESGSSISTSPTDSSEYTAKTSSPLLSPTHSDQGINTIQNDDGCIESAKENIIASENVKPKQIKAPAANVKNVPRQLRQPTNWTGASNKVANGASSGIPRPASRIPGPRFARPNPK